MENTETVILPRESDGDFVEEIAVVAVDAADTVAEAAGTGVEIRRSGRTAVVVCPFEGVHPVRSGCTKGWKRSWERKLEENCHCEYNKRSLEVGVAELLLLRNILRE